MPAVSSGFAVYLDIFDERFMLQKLHRWRQMLETSITDRISARRSGKYLLRVVLASSKSFSWSVPLKPRAWTRTSLVKRSFLSDPMTESIVFISSQFADILLPSGYSVNYKLRRQLLHNSAHVTSSPAAGYFGCFQADVHWCKYCIIIHSQHA